VLLAALAQGMPEWHGFRRHVSNGLTRHGGEIVTGLTIPLPMSGSVVREARTVLGRAAPRLRRFSFAVLVRSRERDAGIENVPYTSAGSAR
jgi:hypothetical protein